MRKRIIPQQSDQPKGTPSENWLDLEPIAVAEVTSEHPAFPIENAFRPGSTVPWRAAEPGEQSIRLLFDHPQRLRRIWLKFDNHESSVTQEFVLRWSPGQGQPYRELFRQQWNFSSPDSTRQVEDYAVQLEGVAALELAIVPDKSGGPARASLSEMRLA